MKYWNKFEKYWQNFFWKIHLKKKKKKKKFNSILKIKFIESYITLFINFIKKLLRKKKYFINIEIKWKISE
jgi:hypothetical protein